MKALSVKQPWAWLICAGYKDIENRSWRIGRKPVPGMSSVNFKVALPIRVYIHASQIKDGLSAIGFVHSNSKLRRLLGEQGERAMCAVYSTWEKTDAAIIGEVDITSCVRESESPWFVGPYGFTLANPKLYETPIPWRGQMGFFEVNLP